MLKGEKIINFLSSFLAFGKLPKESHLMGIAFFLDNIGALITTLFTLILVEKKGLSISEAGMFLSACTVVSLPVILFSGWISDRIGEKKIFLFFSFLSVFVIFLTIPLFDHPISYFLFFLWPQLKRATTSPKNSLFISVGGEANKKLSIAYSSVLFNLGSTFSPLLATFLFRKNLTLVLFIEGLTTLVACLFVLLFIKTNKSGEKKDISLKKSASAFLSSKKIFFFMLGLFLLILVYEQYAFNLPIFLLDYTVMESFPKEKMYGFLVALNSAIVVVFSGFVIEKTKNWSRKKSFTISSLVVGVGYFFLSFPSLISFLAFGLLWAFGEILLINTMVSFFLDHFGKENRSFGLSCRYIFSYLVTAVVPIFFGYAGDIFGLKNIWFLSPFLVLAGLFLMVFSGILRESEEKETSSTAIF